MVLEIMILIVALIIFLTLGVSNMEIYIIFYIVITVCERVLGLTILILIVRFHGNELYYSFRMIKFI